MQKNPISLDSTQNMGYNYLYKYHSMAMLPQLSLVK